MRLPSGCASMNCPALHYTVEAHNPVSAGRMREPAACAGNSGATAVPACKATAQACLVASSAAASWRKLIKLTRSS